MLCGKMKTSLVNSLKIQGHIYLVECGYFTINYSKIRKKRKRWQRNCLFYLSENFKLPPSIAFKLVCTRVQGFRQLWGARVTQLTAFVFCIRRSIHVWLLAQLLSLYSEDEFGQWDVPLVIISLWIEMISDYILLLSMWFIYLKYSGTCGESTVTCFFLHRHHSSHSPLFCLVPCIIGSWGEKLKKKKTHVFHWVW